MTRYNTEEDRNSTLNVLAALSIFLYYTKC